MNIDKDIEIVKELVEHNYLEDIWYLREPNGEHKKFNQAISNVIKELETYKKRKELYKNCISDMAGELVRHSNSCYFRKSEEQTTRYFENKWGLLEDE